MEMTKYDELLKRLIQLYEKVIHGNGKKMGLMSCYDTYYQGCWDNDLEEIEELKIKLKLDKDA